MTTHTIYLTLWQLRALKEGRLSLLLVPMEHQPTAETGPAIQPYLVGDKLVTVVTEPIGRVVSCTPFWLPDITEKQVLRCGCQYDLLSDWSSWVWAVEVEDGRDE
jgi:hypothetical protein